ncbi:transmembrane protein, putative [Medicago truncatula]|uniref:Transmembrane protein, putative n=1 Tax=Medicago truncatula TaxID=3880 RepID=G7KV35_MEDTR|nr:transmembrane protein, putative [Medicago truncatula]
MTKSEMQNDISMVMIVVMIVLVFAQANNSSPRRKLISDFARCFFNCFGDGCDDHVHYIPPVYGWCLGDCTLKCP